MQKGHALRYVLGEDDCLLEIDVDTSCERIGGQMR